MSSPPHGATYVILCKRFLKRIKFAGPLAWKQFVKYTCGLNYSWTWTMNQACAGGILSSGGVFSGHTYLIFSFSHRHQIYCPFFRSQIERQMRSSFIFFSDQLANVLFSIQTIAIRFFRKDSVLREIQTTITIDSDSSRFFLCCSLLPGTMIRPDTHYY